MVWGQMGFEERQQLLQFLVERITVEDGRVTVETVIPAGDDRHDRPGELRLCHPDGVEGSAGLPATALLAD